MHPRIFPLPLKYPARAIPFYPVILYKYINLSRTQRIVFSGRIMNAAIDPSLHDDVRPALEPGEGLLWTGRPDPRRTARAKIGQALLGAVFILSFFLVYLSGLPADLEPYFDADSVPFSLRQAILFAGSLLTLYGVLLPVFAYRTAQRTVYAVTDRRVLSLTRGRPAKMVRYEDMQVPRLELSPDGSGDIQFNGKCLADGTEYQPRLQSFLGIRSAKSVYQLLLGSMPNADDDRTTYSAVQDYLELLFQGKRTLDKDPPRE